MLFCSGDNLGHIRYSKSIFDIDTANLYETLKLMFLTSKSVSPLKTKKKHRKKLKKHLHLRRPTFRRPTFKETCVVLDGSENVGICSRNVGMCLGNLGMWSGNVISFMMFPDSFWMFSGFFLDFSGSFPDYFVFFYSRNHSYDKKLSF